MKHIQFLFLAVFIFITSCVSISKAAPQKRFFTIEADISKIKTISTYKFQKLRINKIKINSLYEGKEFTYRKDFDFESDYYNQFMVSPSTNITEQIIQWIDKSNLAEIITNRFSSSDSNLVLEGNVNLLYADFSGGKIQSVMEIEFFFSDNTKDQVLFQKVYSRKFLTSDKEPVSLVKAWNQALTDILIDLVTDLQAIPTTYLNNNSILLNPPDMLKTLWNPD